MNAATSFFSSKNHIYKPFGTTIFFCDCIYQSVERQLVIK